MKLHRAPLTQTFLCVVLVQMQVKSRCAVVKNGIFCGAYAYQRA